MRPVNTETVIGQADYYQLGAVLGMGKFVGGTPITLTFHGELALGVAHTVFQPNDGITIVGEGNSVTSLFTGATVGIDFLVARMLSVVTSAGVALGFRDPLDASLVFMGGLALRLP
jgi:hypothetical protein